MDVGSLKSANRKNRVKEIGDPFILALRPGLLVGSGGEVSRTSWSPIISSSWRRSCVTFKCKEDKHMAFRSSLGILASWHSSVSF